MNDLELWSEIDEGIYGKAADEGEHLSCKDELQQQEPIKGEKDVLNYSGSLQNVLLMLLSDV
jgi:hypothetical protein